jgi:23S rRNA G2445 N2-methylase RlmL
MNCAGISAATLPPVHNELVRFLATCLPGIAPVLIEEIGAGWRAGFDGRNEVVGFDARGIDVAMPKTAEDVFVEVARARGEGVDQLVDQLVDGPSLERALSVYASVRGRLKPRMSYRVVARVLSEERFLRTTFRDRVTQAVGATRPRWDVRDPAEVELWALEIARDDFVLALRLTTGGHRHRGGRAREREGALRPSVAAAMLQLAAGPAVLVDVCCGSGTILREATGTAIGGDIDAGAVGIAKENTRGAIARWDARSLPLPDDSADAVVSNLPFGHRFHVDDAWYRAAMQEAARVTKPGGAIVVLAPRLPDVDLGPERTLDIELLGMRTTIWRFRVL